MIVKWENRKQDISTYVLVFGWCSFKHNSTKTSIPLLVKIQVRLLSKFLCTSVYLHVSW
jgi:hypothetical protein